MDRDRRKITSQVRAITLVEVLVTLAIVTLLTAIAVPSLLHAKNRSSANSSLGQLRQLGLSVLMYSESSEGWPPFSLDANCYALFANHGRNCKPGYTDAKELIAPWHLTVDLYVADWRLFRSPIDRMSVPLRDESSHESTWYEETRTPRWHGTSFDYVSDYILYNKVTYLSSEPSVSPVLFSLFESTAWPARKQVCYWDGHVRDVLHSVFSKEVESALR